MRSKTVVRSLISGHTTVVAHDDGSINLRVPGHRERRVTIASIPSVLLTMPNRQGQDVLLVGDAHGRLHVIPMELATVAARIDLNAGRIRALAASPTERGDVMVATSNGTVAVVDLEAETSSTLAHMDGPVASLRVGVGYKRGLLEVRSIEDGSVVRSMDLASDMTPISMALVRGQRMVEGVDEALPQVFDEIKGGGFELGLPYLKPVDDQWHLVVTAAWSWA